MRLLPLRSCLKVETATLPNRDELDGLLNLPLALDTMRLVAATQRARHALAGLDAQDDPSTFEDATAQALIRATSVIAVLLEAARFHPPHNATPINLTQEYGAQASLFLRLPEWEQQMYLDDARDLLQHLQNATGLARCGTAPTLKRSQVSR